jgi:hypothetical protein
MNSKRAAFRESILSATLALNFFRLAEAAEARNDPFESTAIFECAMKGLKQFVEMS